MPRKPRPHPYHVAITRYQDADGRRCARDDPGASKVQTRSESYYADLPGQPRVALGTADLGEAWEVLRRKLREQEERQLGIQQPHLAAARAPLAEQVAAWVQAVQDGGTGEVQCRMLRSRVLRVAELAGWQRITDISEESALRALARLQEPHEEELPHLGTGRPSEQVRKRQRRRSAQTRNHYRSHLRQFCSWLVRTRRLQWHPLLEVGRVNVESDRRQHHRDPSDEDVRKLWDYLMGEGARVRRGMSAEQRALGYSVSMATGFRADEVRSLTRESFDLDAGLVSCEASYSKHRRRDTQPLPAWLVEDLRRWLDAGGSLWGQFPQHWPGRLLKADVEAAGVPYSIPSAQGPLTFTFHSLRVWYISRLASQPDMSPAVLFSLARHSDPKLTLKTYAKVRGEQLAGAAGQLPRPAPTAPPPTGPGEAPTTAAQ